MGREPAKEDAIAVKRLREGGAIIIGITNMHELGIGTTGNNPNRLGHESKDLIKKRPPSVYFL